MYLQTLRKSSAFSLVELLVVITILAILSTVAYTSFSGSTDKAKNSKRLEHLGSIESGLQMFYQEKSYYPMPGVNSSTNFWGYASASGAVQTNTGTFTTNSDGGIITVTGGSGGGRVSGSGASSASQVGAKGVMTQAIVGKQFLSQDVADPSSETKVGTNNVLKDYGIGRYPYAVFAKAAAPASWNPDSKSGTAFNIAATILDDQKGSVAKVSGSFDDKFTGCNGIECPISLIGSGTVNIKDGDTALPYAIKY
jgi:prepilin-type N-terminal cleavage/methylation domain-containing protein